MAGPPFTSINSTGGPLSVVNYYTSYLKSSKISTGGASYTCYYYGGNTGSGSGLGYSFTSILYIGCMISSWGGCTSGSSYSSSLSSGSSSSSWGGWRTLLDSSNALLSYSECSSIYIFFSSSSFLL